MFVGIDRVSNEQLLEVTV